MFSLIGRENPTKQGVLDAKAMWRGMLTSLIDVGEMVTNSFLPLKCDFEVPPVRRWSLSLPLRPG